MFDTAKLIVAAVILVVIGLLAWGIKYAIDDYRATAAENAALKRENADLHTSVNELQRDAALALSIAKSNSQVKGLFQQGVQAIQGEIRGINTSTPELKERADRPVPLAIQQRLREYATDAEGYPVVPSSGTVASPDKGAESAKSDRR